MKNKEYLANMIVASGKFAKEEEYWKSRLNGQVVVSKMPNDRNSKELKSSLYSYCFSKEIYNGLKKLSNNSNAAIYTILLSAFEVLIYRYNYDKTVTLGVPVVASNDVEDNVNELIPFTINLNESSSLKEILIHTKENLKLDYKNQRYPYYMLLEDPKIYFNTVVLLEELHNKNKLNESEIETLYSFSMENSLLELVINYPSNKYSKDAIVQFCRHLEKICAKILYEIELKVSEVDLLEKWERYKLINEFNNTNVEYDQFQTIHGLFEKIAAKYPENIAVAYEDHTLNYKELNSKANSLARNLLAHGVTRGSIVGIMTYRSVEMIVAMLAILKAGGVYLPIDPEYPEERIKYMLKDSGTKLILTEDKLVKRINYSDDFINIMKNESYSGSTHNLAEVSSSEDLAYIIYTSGTTGKPKGVMVENKGIVSLVEVFRDELGINPKKRILQFASMSFDACCFETYMAILLGASLNIPSKDTVLNPEKLGQYIRQNKITTATLPPFYADEIDFDNTEMELVITAGSAAKSSVIEKLKGKIRYINAYGPTEDTICTTMWEYIEGDADLIPIGKPIKNHRIYIVDSTNMLLPIGAAGELCISGEGLARGYINKEQLTKEKFVENPYEEGSRMYRTGDLARWRADGNIEYIGRKDNQVKIRGFRIELGEVESAIMRLEGMKEVVVTVIEEENKKLCAYFVSGKEYSTKELRENLKLEIPEYMIPSYFIKLLNLPLNINGKVNKQQLPVYNQIKKAYLEAETDTEQRVNNIWCETLKVKNISCTADFFEAGGDSLKLAAVTNRICSEFGFDLAVADIVGCSTIKDMAALIDKSGVHNKKIDNEMVLLRRGSDETKNIFFIHAGLGNVDSYLDICTGIDKTINLWGIKCRRYPAHGLENISIEELAEEYVNKILMLQQNGEFNVAGWCVGGTIAYEIVSKLEKRGKEIGSLTLINSSEPNNLLNYQHKGFVYRNFELEKRAVMEMISQTEASDKMEQARNLKELMDIYVDYIEKSGMTAVQMKELLPNSASKSFGDVSSQSLREFLFVYNTARTHFSSRAKYIPAGKINSDLIYIKAEISDYPNYKIWESYTTGKFNEYSVAGDHYSVIKGENALAVAKIINAAISKGKHSEKRLYSDNNSISQVN